MFFGWEKIKKDRRRQKLISSLLYVWKRIIKSYFQWKFYGESESKSVHKSINTNKVEYEIDETENEEPSVTDNPVINEPSYFKLFKWGKNFLKNIDATCERACMATLKYNYYTEMCNSLTDYNNHNNTPLFNTKILEAIRKVMEE